MPDTQPIPTTTIPALSTLTIPEATSLPANRDALQAMIDEAEADMAKLAATKAKLTEAVASIPPGFTPIADKGTVPNGTTDAQGRPYKGFGTDTAKAPTRPLQAGVTHPESTPSHQVQDPRAFTKAAHSYTENTIDHMGFNSGVTVVTEHRPRPKNLHQGATDAPNPKSIETAQDIEAK